MLTEPTFIVEELNKEPFLKNLSISLFDSLSPLALIEILHEVLAEIQPKHTENIQGKTDEERVQEITILLSALEYEPIKDCCDLKAITEGLKNKDKVAIHPILFWLLQSVPALKRKVYLAQFTLEVEVPVHLQQEEYIYIYINQQKELIQTFQHRFSVYEDLQPLIISKNNAIADNKMMQNNKDSLLNLRDRLQKDLESQTKSPAELLKVVRRLRLEMEREKELARHTQEQEEQLSQAQQILSKLKQQSRGQSGEDADATTIMTDLQKDIKANTAKVAEKQPAELEDMRTKVKVLQTLAKSPFVTAAQYLELKNQINLVTSKINKNKVEMAINQCFEEEKLNSMKENASIINQKKISKARELQDLKERLESAERELKVSAKQADAHDGRQNLWEKLKLRKNILRKKHQEVLQLKADQQSTERSLKQAERYFQPLVQILEAEKGKPGPSYAQKTLERIVEAKKNEHSQTNKAKIGKLKSMMASLRSSFSAMVEEHSSARRQCYKQLDQFESKSRYRAAALNEKVTLLRDDTAKLEKQSNEKMALLEAMKAKIEAATVELPIFQPPGGDQCTKSTNAKKQWRDKPKKSIKLK